MKSPDYSKGIMVALYPDPERAKELALDAEGAEAPEDLHVTLAFLGERGEDGVPDKSYWPELHDAVKEVAKRHPPVEGGVNGVGQFPEGDNGSPYVGIFGSHTIHDLHKDVTNTLKGKGVDVSDKFPFVPHMTFGYLEDGEEFPNHLGEAQDLRFSHIVVKNGDVTHKFALEGTPAPVQKEAAWDDETADAWNMGKLGRLYYREQGLHTFHISDEDDSGKTVCGQDLPHGDIWVDTPPRKHICPVCTAWHDNEIKKNMEEAREDDIQQSKDRYVPPTMEEQHQPDHEYVGNIGEIQYHIAGCKCGWASNVRSEQAANNAWQRHFDTLNEPGRLDLAGEPSYVHPAPKTKRWGSWVDQVSRPYQDDAIAEPNESIEPVMPMLYQQQLGVWPDDIPEDPTRTVHPVDIFSGPKTGGWKNES